MNVEIYLTPSLQYAIDDAKQIKVTGTTVGECLDSLIRQYPRLRTMIFDQDKKIRQDLALYINESIADSYGTARPIKDGDKIHILDMIIGG